MSNKYPGGIITSGANAGYSVAFDGTGDYLSQTTATTAFDLSAGNWTVEFWVYKSAATDGSIVNLYNTAGNTSGLSIWINSSGVIKVDNGVAGAITTGGTISINAWAHIAVVRSSGTTTLYVNGVSAATTAQAPNAAQYGRFGQAADGTLTNTGYVSNLRIVKGTALYTSTFTPPTQLFNITNTSLLICNSPSIVDQSSNNFTITANGNAAVSTFTPFQGYTAYNPALGASTPGVWTVSEALEARQTRRWNMYDPYFNLTTLLLHGNGTNGAQNNTFLDSSSNNFTITRNGNTTQGTFSPFSQTGWSAYNASTGSGNAGIYLGGQTDFAFGTGDFTIEFWIYLSSSGQNQVVYDSRPPSTQGLYPTIYLNNSTTKLTYFTNSADRITQTSTFTYNTWHHVVVTRTGTSTKMFVDGTQEGSTYTDSNNYINATDRPFTGDGFGATGVTGMVGYMSNLRVVKGSGPYQSAGSSITVPTSPLTPVTNTVLLTLQSNRFVDTNTQVAAKTITTFNSVLIQAFSPFYPVVAYTPQAQGGSGYFDGTGDYLSVADNVALNFGTGDFEISCWIYLTQLTGAGAENPIVGKGNNNVFFAVDSSQTLRLTQYAVGVKVSSSAVVPLNAWSYVVASRVSSTSKLFLNGVEVGSAADTSNYTSTTALQVGQDPQNSGQKFYGYISGLRLVKGSGVTSVTLPTSPPTAITNTSLLTNFTNAGITDATAKNVLETVSSVQVSTTQSKFGGSSMWFQAGGTLAMANSPNLSFGTGDFTVEWWIYWNTLPTASVGFVSGSGSGSTDIRYDGTNLQIGRYLVALDSSFAWTAVTGQWYHVAMTRQGTSIRAFVNGTQIGTTSTNSNTYNAIGNFYVGTVTFGTAGDTPLAYIDDFRITKGYARYTGNFTPQTSQWQDQ